MHVTFKCMGILSILDPLVRLLPVICDVSQYDQFSASVFLQKWGSLLLNMAWLFFKSDNKISLKRKSINFNLKFRRSRKSPEKEKNYIFQWNY